MTGTYTDSMSMTTSLPNQAVLKNYKMTTDDKTNFENLKAKYLAAASGLGQVSSDDEDDSSEVEDSKK